MRKPKHPWANRTMLHGIYFTLCLTEKQFEEVCRHLSVSAKWSDINHASTYHFNGPKHVSVVAVRDWKTRSINQVLSLIVHEAVHVWQNTKAVIGEDNPGREIEAYALQNITQELFELFDVLSKRA